MILSYAASFLQHLEYLYLVKIVQGAIFRRLSNDGNMHHEMKISVVFNSQYVRTCDLETGLLQQANIYDVDLKGSMHIYFTPTRVALHFADKYEVQSYEAM